MRGTDRSGSIRAGKMCVRAALREGKEDNRRRAQGRRQKVRAFPEGGGASQKLSRLRRRLLTFSEVTQGFSEGLAPEVPPRGWPLSFRAITARICMADIVLFIRSPSSSRSLFSTSSFTPFGSSCLRSGIRD